MNQPPRNAVALVWLNGFLYWQLHNGRYVVVRDVAYWRGMVDTFRPSERPAEPNDAEFAAAMGWEIHRR